MKNQYNEMFQDGIPGKNFQSEKMSQRKIFKMEMSLVRIFFSLAKKYLQYVSGGLGEFFNESFFLFCR